MGYTYPIDEEYWSKEEIIDVVNFYSLVEKAYEEGVKKEDFKHAYARFKQIVPSKSEEKTLFRQFEQVSEYSPYHVVKESGRDDINYIKM
ncbi:hypothetical protein AAV35_007655 [Salimicrobium jeotgali]|uniref:Uncharacterized protein n=1 Tax=Salimicrobium jeotgali TaxID=1230341 RepID=K2H811_9BACI|nr:UPF0223 family protein [Salimicrobium jeotgali]AKG04686.1 hypothetical protein AAV35_007655 [Salimicrobium jeotgali]EKE31815.1 hypothetical protein MJ3_06738 [Salimicrobium jeotgali]MBM7696223.1 uncharacterized protein YktA (UPF0223 family) [Salimicrobium jeotgali]